MTNINQITLTREIHFMPFFYCHHFSVKISPQLQRFNDPFFFSLAVRDMVGYLRCKATPPTVKNKVTLRLAGARFEISVMKNPYATISICV